MAPPEGNERIPASQDHAAPSPRPADKQEPRNDSHSAQSSAPTTAASFHDSLVQNSLENSHGGGMDEAAPLHDQAVPMFKSPETATLEARRFNINVQQGEGVSSVSNMQYQVGDRTLSGPVTFNQRGQEYLVDPNSGRYRILPGDQANPNGYLLPLQRNGDTQPIPIVSVKAVSGDAGFRQVGWDAPPDMAKLQQQAKPADSPIEPAKLQQPAKPTETALDMALAAQLANPANRQALADVLVHLQNGRLPFRPDSQEGKQMQGVIGALGPEGLQNLRSILVETQGNVPPRLDSKFNAEGQSNIRQLIELIVHAARNPEAAEARTATPPQAQERALSPLDRFMDSLRSMHLGKLPDAESNRSIFQELGRSLREFNVTLGLDDRSSITIRDITARSFDPHTPVDRQHFSVRDDVATRALIDRLAAITQSESRRGERTAPSEQTTARAEQQPSRPDDMRGLIQKELTSRQQETEAQVAAHAAQNQEEHITKDEGLLNRADKKHEPEEERKPVKQLDGMQTNIDAAAALAALTKKRKLETDAEEGKTTGDKDKKEPDQRTRYVVKQGDTLESIAEKQLRDRHLAALIYEINREVIPVITVNGKSGPQLQERSIIWLPTPAECSEFRGRVLAAGTGTTFGAGEQGASQFSSTEEELAARFGGNWDGSQEQPLPGVKESSLEDMLESAVNHYSERRRRIEEQLGPIKAVVEQDDGKLKHVVRLGDSLKTIAMNHPALKDIRLWKLLAHVNNLSEAVDDKGVPLAKLKRGQVLRLPTDGQITAYRSGQARGSAENPLGHFTAACPTCGRETFISAQICPRCGTTLPATNAAEGSQTNSSTRLRTSVQTQKQATEGTPPARETRMMAPDAEPTRMSATQPPDRLAVTVERVLTDSARITRCGLPNEPTGFRVALEVLRDGTWSPLVVYEIKSSGSQRHEWKPDGSRKTIQVDLPTAAAIELAYNDINSNWKRFIAQ